MDSAARTRLIQQIGSADCNRKFPTSHYLPISYSRGTPMPVSRPFSRRSGSLLRRFQCPSTSGDAFVVRPPLRLTPPIPSLRPLCLHSDSIVAEIIWWVFRILSLALLLGPGWRMACPALGVRNLSLSLSLWSAAPSPSHRLPTTVPTS